MRWQDLEDLAEWRILRRFRISFPRQLIGRDGVCVCVCSFSCSPSFHPASMGGGIGAHLSHIYVQCEVTGSRIYVE